MEMAAVSVTDMDGDLQMAAVDNDGNNNPDPEQTEILTFIDSKLYKAAEEGELEEFKDYAGPLHRLVTPTKNTVLHIHLASTNKRHINFVSDVITKCSSLLRQANDNGDTPLHIAARYGHSDVAILLFKSAKDQIKKDPESGEDILTMVRTLNKKNDTALHEALRYDNLDVIDAILAAEDLKFTYAANDCGETPLYLATKYGSINAFRKLLEAYEDKPLEYGGPSGKTALHAAVMVDDVDKVDKLLNRVSNMAKEADENGWTPLHYAAYFGPGFIAKYLLRVDKSAAYAKDKYRKRTPLHLAAYRGNRWEMRKIISECPDCCELTDIRGWNVLHYAVITNSFYDVAVVLENPSLIDLANREDVNGYTPIHLLYASRSNSFSLDNISDHVIDKDKKSFLKRKWDFLVQYADDDISQKKEEIVKWIEDLGDGPFGKFVVRRSWKEIERGRQERGIPELEKAKDSHLVAAALVATVTFAAAFTLPGGYVSDQNESKLQGTPILHSDAAFQVFVITDAIAMVLSTSSVFIHFVMVMLGYKQRYYWLIRSALWSILLAMGAMVVAFVAGTCAVLAPNSFSLAVTICVIGLSFFLQIFYTTVRLQAAAVRSDRAENGGTIFQSLQRIWVGSLFCRFEEKKDESDAVQDGWRLFSYFCNLQWLVTCYEDVTVKLSTKLACN